MLGLGLTSEPRGMPSARSPPQKQQQLSPTIQRLPLEKSQSYGSPPTVTVNNATGLKSASMPTPMFNPGHQPTNSASNLPAIAGLADAGPYPTAPKQMAATRTSGGLALPGDGVGMGRPATNRPAQGLKPPEEVCLECMMRDRDLADVDVLGEGVWDRESNVAWDELKQREADMLGAMSLDHSISGLSLEDSSSDDASEPSISSPRSQASGLSSEEARRRAVQKKQMREARRAKRDERDAQIARLGWRGFKWEEGQAGEGFPRGFRGTRPGALTEKGIKNVLTMYPSSSTLRYQILQGYLRGQYRLILEVRSEAQRLGRYPEPEEPYYPTSPTQSSHESLALNSVSRRAKARMSVDHVGGALNAPRSLPSGGLHPQTLRPSPSTPAALGQQPAPQLTRPKSQHFPDREPYQQGRPSLNLNTVPQLRPSHLKGPSSSSVPKQRDSRFEDWSDTEDLWPPASPASGQNLRPFSFAVRAGAGREGSDGGHSRRSFLGKWGGSVTSLFTGGTHGGSGSMMDMHLGLEMDRRNRTSSVQDFQRAVSVHQMPSPNSRPPTYMSMSRQSVSSSVYLTSAPAEKHLSPSVHSVQPEHRLREPPLPRPRSASATRLTQISLNDSDLSHAKKKGIKGLLSKMKPKGKKERRMSQHSPSPRFDEDGGSSDLAPPPPMPFLVKSRETNRRRSASSLSQQFMDSQSSLSPPGPPGAIPVQGNRSVSAPLAASSGSGSISPTSSRFERGPQGGDNRRRTDPPPELPPGAELFDPRRGSEGYDPRNDPRRGSTMEMLTASSNGSAPKPIIADTTVYDEPLPLARESVISVPPNGAAPPAQLGGFVPASAQFRRSKQPSLSSRYSTSSATVPNIETPDPAASPSYLTANGLPLHHAGHAQTPVASPGITPTAGSAPGQVVNMLPQPAQSSPPGNLSPNRYKNLPPLPPGMAISPGADVYPDLDQQSISTRASFPDAKRLSTYSANPRSSVISEAPTMHRAALPPSAEYFPTASPRYHQQAGQLAPGPGVPMYMPSPMTDSPSSGGSNGVLPHQMGHPNAPPNAPWQRHIQPRPSFDSAHTRYSAVNPGMPFPLDPSAMPGGRPTHSMYINNQASASTGSFGRFLSRERHIVANSAPQTEDKKERRRGIKSIFSKAR
ncbi:hypothetical protein Q8F55_007478 [Vanrija albida]|uniref:Uncharacterized protein n=1 Tax=Vanrija albida TaxID=181172 RepID=A0ABR3PTN5_9TREE